MWSGETLNKKATKYIHENVNVNGQPNLRTGSFCSQVNEDLLPNECLEPGFPREVGAVTGCTNLDLKYCLHEKEPTMMT